MWCPEHSRAAAGGSGEAWARITRAVLDAARHVSPATVVLIDGPSGAGKSTFAAELSAAWPGASPRLVHMDDLYPGWQGLEAGSNRLLSEVLVPLRGGLPAGWRRWDWTRSEPGGWARAEPGHPLIVEGCGCLTRATAALADVRVWLTAEHAVRKARALRRDHGAFDAHWNQWEGQWMRFLERENPEALADVLIDTTGKLPAQPGSPGTRRGARQG